jgi:hypothetical protein
MVFNKILQSTMVYNGVSQNLICGRATANLVKMKMLILQVWSMPGIMHFKQVLIPGSYANSRSLQPIT